MPAATSRAELLAVCEKEFAKLAALIETIDEPAALAKDGDDTSIKDLVGHRAHWIGLFLGWYHDGLAGEEVPLPAAVWLFTPALAGLGIFARRRRETVT